MKGLGIILMVIGHMHLSELSDKLIYSFHMPLFFIISGFLYRKKTLKKEYVLRKAKNLLLPYIFFGGGYSILYLFIYGTEDIISKIKGVLLISVENLPFESALWFLTVMFETVVLYLIIDNVIKKAWIRRTIVFLLVILGMTWKIIMPTLLPWGIQVTFVAVGFYEIGRFVKEANYKDLSMEKKTIIFVITFVIWISVVILNEPLNMRASLYHIIPLSVIGAISGTYLVYYISELLSKTHLEKTLSNISQWAVLFLVSNHLVLIITGKLVGIVCSDGVQYLFTGIVSIGIMYLASWILYKTPIKHILGR
ncbi:MAG: acyltransferase family protein [Lachnospiraceae bacterium]|nr:acyltransferase family protein [Lachnospiraceae bacterium]